MTLDKMYDSITSRMEDLEKSGRVAEMNGLQYALTLLDLVDEFTPENSRDLAEWVGEQKWKRGLTWREIEKLTGENYKTVWAWVNARINPSMDRVMKILEGLGFEVVIRRRT